jgi:hypothetical protein
VIIVEVVGKCTVQMVVTEHEHVIQVLAPDTVHHAFDVRMLPGAMRGCDDLRDAQTVDTRNA